ncbi:MAG: type IV toxin-antitoxin system AbiEi family antitoxin domain-containing protein [Gammaproteobacteria bacterium]|nr:MAG: type IV toxin-antitoxin system AbiEi family antitoxin domain-containing protein [Gammaproteobacteria bacterium]
MAMQSDEISNPASGQTKKGLSAVLSDGLLVNRNWLKQMGFQRPLVDYYLRSGALEAVARGVYRRPGPPLKWQHVLYSLQELGFAVHVGGRTALDHQGLAHYLPMGTETIHLYSHDKLPGWLHAVGVDIRFEFHHRKLFTEDAATLGYNSLPFGAWDWPLNYSTRERALLEYLDDLPGGSSFDMADKYMESATTLRPDLLMALLLACKRIKTRRLFLWLAERYSYPWFKQLDVATLDLGSGKRVIYKGGVLDTKYNITVPREYANGEVVDGSEQPLF